MNSIADNLKMVRERMERAAARAGRDPASIRLVAVSKTVPAGMIREAYEAGQPAFGENYAQELRDKSRELADLEIEWHFIGHLQRNKAKYAAQAADMVQSVDSIGLAEELDRQFARRPGCIVGAFGCMIEVNLAGESSKSGVAPEEVPALAQAINSLSNLKLRGLMIIPPYDPDPEKSRPYFAGLRQLLAALNLELFPANPLTELSMGMSHDFEVAIEEGATIVRVGTAIFGERS